MVAGLSSCPDLSEVSATLGSMLDDRDKATLDLESMRWKYAAQKDAAIRDRFDETPTAYYARLHRLLRKPEAGQYAPLTVHRLLRLETARRAARSSDRMS